MDCVNTKCRMNSKTWVNNCREYAPNSILKCPDYIEAAKHPEAPQVENSGWLAAFGRVRDWLDNDDTWDNDLDGLGKVDVADIVFERIKEEILKECGS